MPRELTPYQPPPPDEPLDAIQEALVRALVSALIAEIDEELAHAPHDEDDEVVSAR